eukprot:jgi/Mesen1/6754/ME000344S06037
MASQTLGKAVSVPASLTRFGRESKSTASSSQAVVNVRHIRSPELAGKDLVTGRSELKVRSCASKEFGRIRAATLPGGGSGGGLLEKPTLERPTPGRESEFDLKKKKKTSPPYRVMLHNDNFNRREYVVQVLMKVIPGMTVDNAVNIMQEAHVNGLACVITCGQEDAEEHCNQLRQNGLVSSIEPAAGKS